MQGAPIGFNGSFSDSHGVAPKANEDFSKMIKDPVTMDLEQRKQQGGGLQGAPLPCRCYEKVLQRPNKPTCHLWNTPQCGYGCGTCAGSDSCVNFPYAGQVEITDWTAGAPGPYCNMDPSLKCEEGFIGSPIKKMGKETKKCADKRAKSVPRYAMYYAQQCKCNPGSNCAGSSSGGNGCGPLCPQLTQKGGSTAAGGRCQDCQHYYYAYQTYRDLLTGSRYPFTCDSGCTQEEQI